jgi:hypothetical protein
MSLRRRLVFGVGFGAVVLGAPGSPAADAERCPRFVSRSAGLPTDVEWRTRPVLADLNGDGRLDLAGHPRKARRPYVWLAGPDGGWTEASRGLVMPGFTCGIGVDLADVDEDGHLDLGVADHCNGLFVFLGDGAGGWRLGASPMLDQKNNYDDLAFGDLDADGHPDLVAVGSTHGGFVVRLGDGKGGWRRADLGLPRHGRGFDLELADVNRDGRPDVLAAFDEEEAGPHEPRPRFNVAWVSDGNGRYRPAPEGFPEHGKYWGVSAGDVNGDGLVDLALANDSFPDRAPIEVYLGDGGKSWTPAQSGLPGTNPEGAFHTGIDLGDVDGDRDLDLVAMRHQGGAVVLWLNDGKGAWTRCEQSGLPMKGGDQRGWGVTVRDVDGDGRGDVIAAFGREGGGSLEVWVHAR